MKIFKLLGQIPVLRYRKHSIANAMEFPDYRGSFKGLCSRSAEEPELKDFMEYMDSLKNYEKSGVPKGAGTDSDEGFDLRRMRRLLELLDNPHSKFKVRNSESTFFFRPFLRFLFG